MKVDEDVVGAAVLRLHNSSASRGDVAAVVRKIVGTPAFRERTPLLGALATHLSKEQRSENAEAMAQLAFTVYLPQEPSHGNFGTWELTRYAIINSAPKRGSAWDPHIQGHYSTLHALHEGQITDYVASVLQAIESLWAVPGRLVQKV